MRHILWQDFLGIALGRHEAQLEPSLVFIQQTYHVQSHNMERLFGSIICNQRSVTKNRTNRQIVRLGMEIRFRSNFDPKKAVSSAESIDSKVGNENIGTKVWVGKSEVGREGRKAGI